MIAFLLPFLLAACIRADPIENFDRILLFTKDKHNISSVNPLVYADPFHTRMKTIGYTQDQVDEMVQDSYDFLWHYFGLNITSGFYVSSLDAYQLPQGVYLPVDIGREDRAERLVYDKSYPARGLVMSWFRSFSGAIFSFNTNGTFPGGVQQGKPYYSGDALTYGYMDILREDSDWSKSNNRETFLCYSKFTGRQYFNMDNVRDSVIRWECVSADGNTGGALITNVYPKNDDGTIDEIKRTIITMPSLS